MARHSFLDPDLSPAKLQERIYATYASLRVGIGVIGVVFPFFLWLGGLWYAGLSLQGSMSAYYYAVGNDGRSMRDWFVGILFVVGVFLYLYKGFSRAEDWALNVGGALAVGVAVFPMDLNPATPFWLTRHGFCAIGLFLCIAFVALFCADDTLDLIRDTNIPDQGKLITRLKWLYRLIGLAMIGLMIAAYVLNTVYKTEYRTFWIEAAGVVSFGAYWLLKSWELRQTAAELKTIRGQIERVSGRVMSIAAPRS
jgi:hypothetical protein